MDLTAEDGVRTFRISSVHLANKTNSVGDESKVIQASKFGRTVTVTGLCNSAVVVGVKCKSAGARATVVSVHSR